MIKYFIDFVPMGEIKDIDIDYDNMKNIKDIKIAIKKNCKIPITFQELFENDIMERKLDNNELLSNLSTSFELRMQKIALMSLSKLKFGVFQEFMLNNKLLPYKIQGNDTETEQPFGIDTTYKCAQIRFDLDYAKKNNIRYLVSIENGIFRDDNGNIIDFCATILFDTKTGLKYTNKDNLEKTFIYIKNGEKYFNLIKDGEANTGLGFTKTIGSLLAKDFKVPKNNWMKKLNNFPRERQMYIALKSMFEIIY